MLPVWMCNCDEPDDYGVAQYCVPALVYVAQDNYTHKGMVNTLVCIAQDNYTHTGNINITVNYG